MGGDGDCAAGEPVKIDMPQCAEALRALLRFIYLDEADAAQCASHLGEVLELAAMHDLPELGAACEQHAVKAVSAERLGEYVAAAELHGLDVRALLTNLVTGIQGTTNFRGWSRIGALQPYAGASQAAIAKLPGQYFRVFYGPRSPQP